MAGLLTHMVMACREWKQEKKDVRAFREFLRNPVLSADRFAVSPTARLLMMFLEKFLSAAQTRVDVHHDPSGLRFSDVFENVPSAFWQNWMFLLEEAAVSRSAPNGGKILRLTFGEAGRQTPVDIELLPVPTLTGERDRDLQELERWTQEHGKDPQLSFVKVPV